MRLTVVTSVCTADGGNSFSSLALKKARKSIKSNAKRFLAPNAVKLSVQAPAVVVTYPDIVSKSRRSCNNQGNNITMMIPIGLYCFQRLKIFAKTFIREYFRLQDRIKHS